LKQLKIINNNGLVLQNITLPNEQQLANTIPTNLVHLPTYHTPHPVFSLMFSRIPAKFDKLADFLC